MESRWRVFVQRGNLTERKILLLGKIARNSLRRFRCSNYPLILAKARANSVGMRDTLAKTFFRIEILSLWTTQKTARWAVSGNKKEQGQLPYRITAVSPKVWDKNDVTLWFLAFWWFSAADSHLKAKKLNFQNLILDVTNDRFIILWIREMQNGYC